MWQSTKIVSVSESRALDLPATDVVIAALFDGDVAPKRGV